MNQYLNTTLRNVLWFKNAHDHDELDMKPPFQRNPVWVTRQKSFLIDSILNGYPIPEIYMQEVIKPSGSVKHIIVDGQQRIRTVLEFISGQFTIDPVESPSWADMGFEDISEDDRKKIFSYNFVVRILPDIDDVLIRAIFQRLNKNVLALNKQELRQAAYWGGFIKLMNEISDKEIWQDFSLFTQNDIRRMLDVEFISELAIAFLNGIQNKKDKIEDFYRIYEEEFLEEDKKKLETTFNTVLIEISTILPDIRSTRWHKKTDFYTLFLVMANRIQSIPFNKEKRIQAHDLLLKFSAEIDNYLSSSQDQEIKHSENVIKYGSGIRASTDLNSRKKRDEGLSLYLKALWQND